MKVTHKQIGGPSTTGVESAKSARGESASGVKSRLKPGELSSGSKVDVSERAQMMQRAKSIAGESSIDEAKVARLQKLIDEGNYKVDSGKVADRLVDEHLLMPDTE